MTRIKRNFRMLTLLAAGSLLAACSEQHNTEDFTEQEAIPSSLLGAWHAPTFAEPDNSKELTGTPAQKLQTIFNATGPSIITSIGRMGNEGDMYYIAEDEYGEIAEFTTKLVKNMSTQAQKHDAIFSWITKNITYGESDPAPYAVFINKRCVCQGYANLLTVMCHTQGIPAVVVNGILDHPTVWGGHAWNYVCLDGVWMVSDPTNGGKFKMSEIGKYTHLLPSEADVDLFADDCATYRYYDYQINVHEVTTTDNTLIVPYSIGGFVITSFNPNALSSSVTDIYLGENIATLGETYNMTLTTMNLGKNVRAIHVDEANQKLASHKGIVYRKNGYDEQLYYIPGGMELIELKPMKLVDKNTIYNHANVKQIYFPEGTKKIESYAIENCPKLERVYIPEGVEIAGDALYNCPSNVEIIYGAPSSVKHVTM